MRFQRTLNGVVSCEGISLHSGQKVKTTIRPAPADSGIYFIRADFDDAVAIPASSRFVTQTFYSTTLGLGSIHVGTVEHLMAAFYALGISNAEVRIQGDELPILDGSSKEWVSLLRQVGVQNQMDSVLPEIVIRKPLGVKEKDAWATLYPAEVFSIDCQICFDHPAIGFQQWEGCLSESVFIDEIAPARTFGMLKDVPYLLSQGRAQGATLSNVIILNESKVVSHHGLRYKNEFVRHKVLDAVGDLSLLGMPIRGHLVSCRAGHKIHQQLIKVLLESRDCWEICGREREFKRPTTRFAEPLRVVS